MSTPPSPIDDDALKRYLGESLPATEMARVEKALRESAELRQRLEDVRTGRQDPMLHTLGAIWKRGRLSCPTRQQLGSFLLDALDDDLADYISFHIREAGCPYCLANLTDLKARADQPQSIQTRRQRYFHSSRHLLSGDE